MVRESRGVGALVNLNYKYKEGICSPDISGADAHSSFGANHRWGIFKGISVGWRFSEEPFLDNLNFLGESMLRASWGVSGRQPEDQYARFAPMNLHPSRTIMIYPGIVNTQIQLDNLQWESINPVEYGNRNESV